MANESFLDLSQPRWTFLLGTTLLPTILAILLAPCIADAQKNLADDVSPKSSTLQCHLLIGPALSNWWGAKNKERVPNPQYCIGLGLTHAISKQLEVDLNLLWEKKGHKQESLTIVYDPSTLPQSRFVQGTRLDYISLSIMMNYFLSRNHRFSLGLGGYFSNLRHAEGYSKEYNLQGTPLSYYHYNINFLKKFDSGLSSAFKYHFNIKQRRMNAQLNANIGFTDLINRHLPNGDVYAVTRNYNLSLLLAITLNKN